MKFSINWLREFVELPASIEALEDLLTRSGIEIEALESRGGNLAKVVVAQICESRPHPNADRLSVCQVDDGSGTLRKIVCGATNYQVGDKVALALPGAELPGGLKIRASKLRGVESEGMLCSARELALAEDASGLLILTSTAEIGSALGELFPPDVIVEAEITPNRGDLLSHYGLAREIASLSGASAPKLTSSPETPRSDGPLIEARTECPFYSARRIENVRVGVSPDWLRAKIESVGVRSINNVVDVTNLVMLERGQPLHAFDAEKLQGEIHVRLAREGEEILALNGRTYALHCDDLVIADGERAIAIAGVMGGQQTAVTSATANVVLESAYFLPSSVRRTARRLSLPTDSSYRFERGVDSRMVLSASYAATDLLRKLAAGRPLPIIAMQGELPEDPPPVPLRLETVDRLLGVSIAPDRVEQILTSFGLSQNGGWKIPSYRRDLKREVDLVEEIIRAHGIEHIPSADRSRFTSASAADRIFDAEAKVAQDLAAAGLDEARTSSLVSRAELGRGGPAISLRNPLSEDHVALRVSLLPGLLGALERNARAGATRIALFEMGDVFLPEEGVQERALAITMSGRVPSHWRGGQVRALDFFDLKGALMAISNFEFRRAEKPGLVLAVELLIDDEHIGFCGQLARSEAVRLGVEGSIYIAELELGPVTRPARRERSFRELDRYPAMKRDIAMFVPPEVTHGAVMQEITLANEPLLQSVELFDFFRGKEQAENGRQSLAYSLTYRAENRTLTSEEVSTAHDRIRERLRHKLGAELREH